MKKHEILAVRLAEIIHQLYQGERLDIEKLSVRYEVSSRTLQRDLKNRLSFLDFYEQGPRYYQLNKQSKLFLSDADIERFARFASIQDLFPKIDRTFYQEQLLQSIKIKGYKYQSIAPFQKEFDLLKKAIEKHQNVMFSYLKNGERKPKNYQISPYSLVNKNGIWYLMGEQDKQLKTFCVSQISLLRVLDETFEPNSQTQKMINSSDSIYHGNQQINEIIIKTNSTATPYFKRRALLPNQKIIRELDDGGLLIACHNVHELEVVPIVQYWIPHLTIISPDGLQDKMEQNLRDYLNNQTIDLVEVVHE